MVFEHLYGSDVVWVDIVGGYAVMSFHKVKSLDIQVFNRLTLI